MTKTLVVFVCPHRSGSSAAARVFRELGLSLGPFPLLGAHRTNPHGFFEAEPFVHLNVEVQTAAFGFPDDVPPTPEGRAFLASGGEWPAGFECRPDWISRGRDLIASLLASGPVSGFKDPRTALVWPFWKGVLDVFPEARVVPVVLVRSPHEIAMSLFTRSRGGMSYLHCLEAAACHYRALQRVVSDLPGEAPRITFGSPDYVGQLRRAAEACGLPWSEAAFAAAYDPACYHHRPAVTDHEAEELFAALAGIPHGPLHAADNLERLRHDATEREALLGDELAATGADLGATRSDLAAAQAGLAAAQASLATAQAELAATRAELAAAQAGLAAAQASLATAQAELAATRADLAAARSTLTAAAAQAARDREAQEAVKNDLEAARAYIATLNRALSLRLARAVGMPFVRMTQVIYPPRPAGNHSALAPGRGRAAEIWFQASYVLRHEGFGALLRETWRFLREGPRVPPAVAEKRDPPPSEADRNNYPRWIEQNEPDAGQLAQQRGHPFAHEPLISILVPVYQTPPSFLRAMIESVQAQTYAHWELCLADGNSPNEEVRRLLEECAARDPRIRVRLLEENRGIAGNSAAALELATGSCVALLDHDDVLPPFALFEVAHALNEHPDADMLYSDEDHIDEQGRRFSPHFKPDWSPDTLEGHNYICHLLVLSRQLLQSCGGFREGFEGSQDYDLVLRAGEQARQIVHIPKVLYHWRVHAQSFSQATTRTDAFEAGRRAIEAHLERIKTAGRVEHGPLPGTYQVIRSLPRQPLVSIIIPTHDQHQTLDCCLKSIDRSSYRNYEILLAENNSKEPQTFAYYQSLADRPEIRLLTWNNPFNYAAVNNWAASQARGEVLLLLNNDTEVRNADWLERLLEHALRPEVGAVGAKLYYPDGSIQHGGVILGIGGVAGHAHRFFASSSDGYFHRLVIAQNLTAVTGACLMLHREVFDEVGGLDERYILAFNDVDFCLRIRRRGYRVIWTPFAQLNHHEIKTRGTEDTPEKVARFESEFRTFQETWSDFLEAGDPFYSPNLSLTHEDFSLRV